MGNEKWKDWISGLRAGEKLPKKNQLVLILLAGVLLIVIVFPVPDPSESTDRQSEGIQETMTAGSRDNGDYEQYLEEKTAERSL